MDNHKVEPAGTRALLTMTFVLGEAQCQKFASIAKQRNLRGGTVVLGKGTVKSTTLNLLGIRSQRKEIVSILIAQEQAGELMDFFTKELQLDRPGHGIVYTTPVVTASMLINDKQDIWVTLRDVEGDCMYKKLTVVVNRGIAEDVIEIARKSGVKGGTIMHGRGTGSEFTEKLFGMQIEPEKELVMILLPSELVEPVVNDLFRELRLDDPGNGILFVEPVVEVRGLFDQNASQ